MKSGPGLGISKWECLILSGEWRVQHASAAVERPTQQQKKL